MELITQDTQAGPLLQTWSIPRLITPPAYLYHLFKWPNIYNGNIRRGYSAISQQPQRRVISLSKLKHKNNVAEETFPSRNVLVVRVTRLGEIRVGKKLGQEAFTLLV